MDGKNVKLTDVCEQPMAPQFEHCLIQSIPNYWQNDPELLNASIHSGDYTTKIVGCIRYKEEGGARNLFYFKAFDFRKVFENG